MPSFILTKKGEEVDKLVGGQERTSEEREIQVLIQINNALITQLEICNKFRNNMGMLRTNIKTV